MNESNETIITLTSIILVFTLIIVAIEIPKRKSVTTDKACYGLVEERVNYENVDGEPQIIMQQAFDW